MDPQTNTQPVDQATQAVGQAVQSGAVPPPAPSQPPMQPVGGLQKEALPPLKPVETVTVVEVGKDHELEPEVEGWMEHLKQAGEITLPEPIKDDQGNVVLAEAPVQVVNDKIVVPMTQSGMQSSLKKPVTDSARWLAEWVKRLVQMFGERIAFRKVD